jgi:ankyrin repeat protein
MKKLCLVITMLFVLASLSCISVVDKNKGVSKPKFSGTDKEVEQIISAITDDNRKAFDDLVNKNPSIVMYVNPDDKTTLAYLAVKHKRKDMLVSLIKKGAHLDVKRKDNTALAVAIYTGANELAKILVDAGAKLTRISGIGKSALHVAALANNSEMINYLVDSGMDPSSRTIDIWGVTPLHDAANQGSYNAAKALIEKGAKVNKLSLLGATPLDDALHGGNGSIVNLLKEHGAHRGPLGIF